MKKLIVCRGLPASGKSTWAKQLLVSEPEQWKRVNKDELRLLIDNDVYSKDNESFIESTQQYIVRRALERGYNVVVDNTCTLERQVRPFHEIAQALGDVIVIEKFFNISVENCIAWDALRESKVGSEVIERMAIDFVPGPDQETSYPHIGSTLSTVDPSLPWAIVSDIDGTIALCHPDRDVCDATLSDMDPPREDVIKIIKSLWLTGDEIIFITSRDEKHRDVTVRFLDKQFTIMSGPSYDAHPTPIKYELYMRPTGSEVSDNDLKRELYEHHVLGRFNTRVVFEDRPRCVRMWRYDLNLTVAQLSDKEF